MAEEVDGNSLIEIPLGIKREDTVALPCLTE